MPQKVFRVQKSFSGPPKTQTIDFLHKFYNFWICQNIGHQVSYPVHPIAFRTHGVIC